MSKNVKLEEVLNGYKVTELKELAKKSNLTGYSKWKKAELVSAIAEQLEQSVVTDMDLPEEILETLHTAPKAEEKVEEKVENTVKADAPKAAIQQSAPIVGVAPHVMNVRQSGAPVMTQVNKPISTRKVYPNDPCPCGSGKKYKKCCGKNK